MVILFSWPYFYGAALNSTIKIILDADLIHIQGGQFYTFGGNTFSLTSNAQNCIIEGCFFNSANPIDDSLVGPGYVPSIRGCRNYIF